MALKPEEDKVYLIDGSGYIFRAFYAIRSLQSKSGIPTNAVFGFATMLLKLLKEHHPHYIAIAFDQKEPTFRHKIYPLYKANRQEPPKDLLPQFSLIHSLVKAMNIKILSLAGYEADDIIATLVKKAHKQGKKVIIVTGDKDLMQLVDDNTFLLDELRAQKYGQETLITTKEVKAEFGVYPKQIIDMLALAGDTSDNIPGVDGIGKKTAAELINDFGSLANIFKMAALIKQKSRREKLILGENDALLSQKLVALDDNVPIDCELLDLSYHGVHQEALKTLFIDLDFKRLLKDEYLFPHQEDDIVDDGIIDKNKYIIINNEEDFFVILKKIKSSAKIAIKIKTDILDSNKALIIGLAIAWHENEACYINIDDKSLSMDIIKQYLYPILVTHKIIVGADAKFDHKVLSKYGLDDFAYGGDPTLSSYLLYQDQEKHDLIYLSEKYLHHKIKFTEEGNIVNNHDIVSSMEIADITLRLEKLLLDKLKLAQLADLYYELELPLIAVLSRMEKRGVMLDKSKLFAAGEELKTRLSNIEKLAFSKAGEVFNLSSPKKVAEVLFVKLKLPAKKKNKTGYSTDSLVLADLSSHHELPGLLLEHRMLAKLINTYIESLPKLINDHSGRIHTSYNQVVTATGRLSSSDPNLQNIPARSKEGLAIRSCFVAAPGYKFISLDYSQVELRILAFISKDPVLLDSFRKDEDVHTRTAAEIFNTSINDITKEQRDAAKTINFGLLYGMGVHKLAQTLQISRQEAQKYLDKYYERYAGIFAWKNEALSTAQQNQEVRTLFGRKRYCKDITSSNTQDRARAERIAINTPIQGSAADIIKKAMIDIDRYLLTNYPDSYLIMQVHDELIIEAKSKDAHNISQEAALIMSKACPNLDLKVNINIGDNWAEAK